MASPTLINEYLNISGGDVMIFSPAGPCWRLRSSDLVNGSLVFRDLLVLEKALTIDHMSLGEVNTIRWNVEMIEWESDKEDPRLRTFVLLEPGFEKNPKFNPSVAQGVHPHYNTIYDNIFRVLHNLEPELAKVPEGAAGAALTPYLTSAFGLFLAAEQLMVTRCIASSLQLYFLKMGRALWPFVEEQPEAFAVLAARIKAPLIFKEAMIHLVGRIDAKKKVNKNYFFLYENDTLRKDVWYLAEKKAKELYEMKLVVERRLIEFFPQRMFHPQVNNTVAARSDYANDIWLWQAQHIVLQYTSSAILKNFHHRASDGGMRFYRTIAKGGDAYLHTAALEPFLRQFSMTGKAKVKFGEALNVVKEEIKICVENLIVDRCQAKRGDGQKVEYFTCTVIRDSEMPWFGRGE